MRSILLVLAFLFTVGGRACASEARDFVTVDPEPEDHPWWARARFHPFETAVRSIPVQRINKDWCKASEFRRELFPLELQEDLKLQNFAVDGFFIGSKVRQTALVGVYETCDGVTGKFLLVVGWPRQGAPTVMFLRGGPFDHQFTTVVADKEHSSIWIWTCMDCDSGVQLKWDRSKRTFVAVPEEY
jgi:hypothetical protein